MANEGRIATLDSTVADRLPVYSKLLFDGKAAKGLSFETIAKHLDRSEVACAALFYGQATASPEDIERLSELLEISKETLTTQMTGFPNRGQAGPMPPVEPLIYRLYEIVQNYGYAYKAILNEKFGDGIMSAICFSTTVDKEVDEAGAPWVVITLKGKWQVLSPLNFKLALTVSGSLSVASKDSVTVSEWQSAGCSYRIQLFRLTRRLYGY